MTRMKIGTAMFRRSVLPLRRSTVESARSREPKIRPIAGRTLLGAGGAEVPSAPDFDPCQSDEHVFEGDVAAGDLHHARVLAVLCDQSGGRVDGEELSVVDDR